MVKESKKFEEIRGFRTLYPEDFIYYKILENKLDEIIKRWGYFPIEPPSLEYGEALTAKGGLSPDQAKELFIFKDHDDRWIGLRFDLTTPIARIVGYDYENFVTKMPIRWYYFSKMWRYENDPKKGRYREFWQFGIELIGSDSPVADAEILAIAVNILKNLGFKSKDVKILVSHREILFGLISKYISNEDEILNLIRLIDKKDKIDFEEIIKKIDYYIKDEDAKNIIIDMLNNPPDKFENMYEKVFSKIEKINDRTEKSINNLKQIFEFLKFFLDRTDMDYFLVDPSIARGFDYYTGLIFEIYVYSENGRQGSSILGGGRYDNLIDLYGGMHTPSIGFALGVDRCIETMRELKILDKLGKVKFNPDVHIIVDIKNIDYFSKAISIKNELASNGLFVTYTLNPYSSWRKMLKNELEYADNNKIPYAIIIDDNIFEEKVLVKDMKNRNQELVEISKLIEKIKN